MRMQGTTRPRIAVLVRRARKLRPETGRAALWAWRAARRARRQVRSGSLDAVTLPPAPRLGAGGEATVSFVLRRRGATCLEAALVRQAMLAALGIRRELVIGVARDGGTVRAHAWLEGEAASPMFTVLARTGDG